MNAVEVSEITNWVVVCIAVDVLIIGANSVEQLLLANNWSRLDRIDHLFFSLSVSDLLHGLVVLVMDLFFWSELMHSTENIVPKILLISSSIFLFTIFSSVFHTIAIAIERFYAIKFPTKYHVFTTYTVKCVTLILIWIGALSFSVLVGILNQHITDKLMSRYLWCSVLMSSAAVVFFTYTYIACLLFRQRRKGVNPVQFNPRCYTHQKRLNRLTILCLILGISFVLCILPVAMGRVNPIFYHPANHFLISFNSLINPCIYFLKMYQDDKNKTRQRFGSKR